MKPVESRCKGAEIVAVVAVSLALVSCPGDGGSGGSGTTNPGAGGFLEVTNGSSANISAYSINMGTGQLTAVPGAPFPTSGTQPQGLVVDPSGKFAYVSNTGSDTIAAYVLNLATGALSLIGGVPIPAGGNQPQEIAVAALPPVAPTQEFAFVSNTGSNSISVFSIDLTSGRLTPIVTLPTGGAPRPATVHPTGQFVYVSNTGSANISGFVNNLSTGGAFTSMGVPFTAGSQPQRVTIDPTGHFAYVANAGSATVSAYSINQVTGVLTPIMNPLTGLPTFPTGTLPQAVTVDVLDIFAYVANQGDGTVSGYTINSATGSLTPMTGSPFPVGTNPQAVTIVPSNEFSGDEFAYVANTGSGNVSAFAVDPLTGVLIAIAGSPFGAGMAPQSVVVDPSGEFAFVPALGSNNVSVYFINQLTGALSPVTGSPFPTGTAPQSATTAGTF